MGLLSNRIKREELQPGDHIYAYRKAHAYSHHGIFVGGDRVIHFTQTNESSKTRIFPRCRNCGHDDPNTTRGVLKTCIDCFLNDHGLLQFEYGVSDEHFKFKKKGTCSTESCDPPDECVRRAIEILDDKEEGFGKYDLLSNNCETFATYCKTGNRVSEQALKAISVGNTSSVVVKEAASFIVSKAASYLVSMASSSSSS